MCSEVPPIRHQMLGALSHRMRAAWKSWAGIRNQVRAHRISLFLRMQLREGVVLPSPLRGLETLCVTRTQRDKLTILQRIMVGRMLKLFLKSRESRENVFKAVREVHNIGNHDTLQGQVGTTPLVPMANVSWTCAANRRQSRR